VEASVSETNGVLLPTVECEWLRGAIDGTSQGARRFQTVTQSNRDLIPSSLVPISIWCFCKLWITLCCGKPR